MKSAFLDVQNLYFCEKRAPKYDLRSNFDHKGVKMSKKWSRRVQKWDNGDARVPKGDKFQPQAWQLEPKWSQKGATESPKAAKWSRKGAKRQPKGDQNTSKNRCANTGAEKERNRGVASTFFGAILGAFSIKNVIKNRCKKWWPKSEDFWCKTDRNSVP